MRRTFWCLGSLVVGGFGLLLAAVPARGGDSDKCDRAEVVKFLEQAVLGRTLVMPKSTFKWDKNKAEVDLEERYTYHNLAETKHGFGFDVTNVVEGTVYDLDSSGRRITPGRPWSGAVVARYEIGERASTGKLTGYSRILSTTVKDSRPAGTIHLVTGMKVADGKLTWNLSRPGYSDAPAAGGGYKPVSVDETVTFWLEDGKLREETDIAYFDVDPDTLKRSQTPLRLPPVISKEIAGR
jgi:hypothetical protein